MATKDPKVLFEDAKHSEIYERFRPPPPPAIIQSIVGFLEESKQRPWELAVDVGCGTGKATRLLSPHFTKVLGLDVSSSQVEQASASNPFENISFKVSGAEKLPVEAASVDLLVAFVALHWFDQEKFWREAKRVLKPDGIMAAFSFWDHKLLCDIPGVPEDCCLKAKKEFMDAIKEFWNPLAFIALSLYKDVEFPFSEVRREYSQEMIPATLEEYTGYLESFSPFQQLSKTNPKAAAKVLDKFVSRVLTETGLDDPREVRLKIQRDFGLVLCRGPK